MLVLSRNKTEEIVMVDNQTGAVIATTTIVEIRGDKVRLGIDADRERYAIHRREVWEAIQRERREQNAGPVEFSDPGFVA